MGSSGFSPILWQTNEPSAAPIFLRLSALQSLGFFLLFVAEFLKEDDSTHFTRQSLVFKMNVIGFSLICRLHIFYFRMWIVSLSCSVPRHQKPNKIIEEAVWPLR